MYESLNVCAKSHKLPCNDLEMYDLTVFSVYFLYVEASSCDIQYICLLEH